MNTMDEVATAGVDAQANIDKYLFKALEAAKRNTEVTARGIELGMVKALKGKVLINKARRIEGLIAEAALAAAELHIEQTKVCADNGADTGSITTVGGVDVGGVHTEGGGR